MLLKEELDLSTSSKFRQHLNSAGFEQVGATQVPPIFLNEESKSLGSLTLESIAEAIINEQLVVPAELNALIEELQSFEQRPDTIIGLPGIYQVLGYKI